MNFNLVFSALVSIALLSGGTSVSLASQPNPSEPQIGIINTCTDTWKICVGAIAGLLGGRSFPDDENDRESDDR